MKILYFDGGCGPKNPGGVAAYGFCILNDKKVIYKEGGYVGEGTGMTNNIAEYNGLLHGLKHIIENGGNREIVKVYGDSKLVINMVTKKWGYRNGAYDPHYKYPELRKLLKEIHSIIPSFMEIAFEWRPRRYNNVADGLAGEIIKNKVNNNIEEKIIIDYAQ